MSVGAVAFKSGRSAHAEARSSTVGPTGGSSATDGQEESVKVLPTSMKTSP